MNPFDMTVFVFEDVELLTVTFDTMAGGDIDVVVSMMETYDYEGAPFTEIMGVMVATFCRVISDKKVCGIVAGALPETLPESVRRPALAAGIAPIQGLEEMVYAVEVGARFGEFFDSMTPDKIAALATPEPPIHTGEPRVLDEWESKQWLARSGVSVPNGQVVTPNEAGETASSIGYPVVLKVVDASLLHKSEAGAVALNLCDKGEVASALSGFAARRPVSKVLVEPMVKNAVAELIIGVKYDEAFGHALVIGAGGVLVELLTDSVTLLLPTHREAVAKGLDSLRIAKLLKGFRGQPPGDREALIDAILAVAGLAIEQRQRLVEIDVNPLMVLPQGQGVVAADALVRICE